MPGSITVANRLIRCADTVEPADTLCGYSYLVDYKAENDTCPYPNFAAYSRGDCFRFDRNRLREYHNESNPEPFARHGNYPGIHRSGLFAELFPAEIARQLREYRQRPDCRVQFFPDTLVQGTRCDAILVTDGLLRSAEAIYQDKKNRYRVSLAKNHLQSLLLDIYDKYHRFYNQAESGSGDRQDELFKNFIMLLNEHSTTEREVAFYARQLGISTKYLSGICRHIANKSAKEVIDNFAILQIKVLLQSTELSIVEIADRLRFPDQSYMGRYFKRHEGITPKEYRAGKNEEW